MKIQTITESPIRVRASATGTLSGENLLDSIFRVRGELGNPHLPFLPELPQRGYAATTLARTIATLDELHAEGASYGWRLSNGTSRESELARSTFRSDINLLADVIGQEEDRGKNLKLQFMGPISLAVSLYLPNGERAISDHGARRDIRDSFLNGLSNWIDTIDTATGSQHLYLQLEEPYLETALHGNIPTASGYRTIRHLPQHELQETYGLIQQHLQQRSISLAITRCDIQNLNTIQSIPDALWFDTTNYTQHDWEKIAPHAERGKELWLATTGNNLKSHIPTQAYHLWKSWRTIGLPAQALSQVTLYDNATLHLMNIEDATSIFTELVQTAQALSEIAQDS
ncbi:methionine synthase [Rothia sp. CCM 9419]|uniref:methionine synthase n=1 Tax=Rothia sp. CCM 9419 TaxID=3402662 RepID=UPI003AE0645B